MNLHLNLSFRFVFNCLFQSDKCAPRATLAKGVPYKSAIFKVQSHHPIIFYFKIHLDQKKEFIIRGLKISPGSCVLNKYSLRYSIGNILR